MFFSFGLRYFHWTRSIGYLSITANITPGTISPQVCIIFLVWILNFLWFLKLLMRRDECTLLPVAIKTSVPHGSMPRTFQQPWRCLLASPTVCQGTRWHYLFSSPDAGGWTRRPHTWTRVLLLSDRPSTCSTFFFWDRITDLPERALSSLCRPERYWLPWEALPNMWLTHLALEMAKYYWSSNILFMALILFWIFQRKLRDK